MNKRCLQNFCAALMIFAALIRAAVAVGLDGAAQTDAETPAPAPVWTLIVERDAPAETPLVEEEPTPEAVEELPDEPAGSVPDFTDAEADAIEISGACSYSVDKRALLRQPTTLDFSQDGPKVLIVHTHSCEAYTPTPAWDYTASDSYRTRDETRSVLRVGSEIQAVLEDAGIETIHDTALNDDPAYSGAYARMLTTIEGYLARYPSIQMVLDVHRDAVENPDGTQVCYTTELDGERCAQVMLVVGTDEGGLEHPHWRENLANALKLQALLNRSYPGLCRPIDLRTERFNAHTSPGALLAEFGAAGNTLPEAIRAGRYFAQGVAEFIQAAARTDA